MVRAVRYNRYSLAAYRFTHTAPGVAVQPRVVFDLCCEDALAAADWLQEATDATAVTGTAGPRVDAVAGLLRRASLNR